NYKGNVMDKKQSAFLISTLLMIASCATIVTGTSDTISFNSEPDGATVTVAGRVIGKTPVSVVIDKDTNQAVTFEKDGYKTFTTQLSTTTNPWFFGNIVIGGLLGSTTDGVSGAIIEYSPDQYFATLTPEVPFGINNNLPRRVKEVVVAFGDDIRVELAAGSGPYTTELLGLLGVDPENHETSIKVLTSLANQSDDNLEFAESIIEFYELRTVQTQD